MRALIALLAVYVCASAADAQTVQTRISHDTIRVGDPFRAIVRIELPAGMEIMLPDSLTPTEDVENAGKVRMRRDSANGVVTVVAAYPLTAWRTGLLELPMFMPWLRDAEGRKQMAVALPDINVVSVLPADTAKIKPKPPKDVLGPDRLWWPWILLAVVLALALAALYWWWRRRRRAHAAVEAPIPAIMPRERALREIERIRKLGLVEQKEYKRYYSLLTDVVRPYMQTIEPAWSTHLTTEELAARTAGHAEVKPAMSLLRRADLVKFARSIPEPDAARADLEHARAWVSSYPALAAVHEEKVA